MGRRNTILITGFMGSGKTSTGRLLASWLKLPFHDMDSMIEKEEGLRISDIFRERGEAYFRDLESSLLVRLLKGRGGKVIATGGGTLTVEGNMDRALESAVVVYLEASVEEVKARLGKGDGTRPLYRDGAGSKRLFEERRPTYERAHIRVRTAGRPPEGVASETLRLLKERGWEIHAPARGDEREGLHRVGVELDGGRGYDIVIGSGILPDSGIFLKEFVPFGRVALVTNPTVADLYLPPITLSLERVGIKVLPILIPDGEEFKTLEWVESILDSLEEAGFERGEPVIALGGGVIGDIASFAASIHLRGVPVIQIPTTLLSQVDSSVGGKTGVNTRAGKNLVGTFYQPALVFIDTEVLKTLGKREFLEGMAEVLKYGLILDRDFFHYMREKRDQLLALDPVVLPSVIKRCCEIKRDVVERDEKEGGVRSLLNLGHTLGHAMERAEGYGFLRHGEAVAKGISFALFLSREKGYLNEEEVSLCLGIMRDFLLPITLHPASPPLIREIMEGIRMDKKVRGGRVRFVVLEGIGKAGFLDMEFAELERLLLEWAGLQVRGGCRASLQGGRRGYTPLFPRMIKGMERRRAMRGEGRDLL